MRNRGGGSSWVWLLALGGVAYFVIKGKSPTPTPLSVYPEYAYTAQTSMAATNKQKAPAVVIPTTYFQSVQGQELSAVLTQCAGSYPGCTVLSGDTQLGL